MDLGRRQVADRPRSATLSRRRRGSSRCPTAASCPTTATRPSWPWPASRIRLAFVAALQHLPPRQRAVLILREVLRWKADEVAELLDTTVASVNSALQRARAPRWPTPSSTPARRRAARRRRSRSCSTATSTPSSATTSTSLTALLHEDATLSMPPYELWLQGPRTTSPAGCSARASAAAGHGSSRPWPTARRPSGSTGRATGGGHEPWALQVVEISSGRIDGHQLVPRHRAACSRSSACRLTSTDRPPRPRRACRRRSGQVSGRPSRLDPAG